VFFHLSPSKAILGDSNDSLIEVYRTVRDTPDRLYDRLCRIKRDEETYYRWRGKSPGNLDPETRVVRFLYLNRNCFNGIYRLNTKGEFNVPHGGIKPTAYFSRADLVLCASLLKNVEFLAGDFATTLDKVQAGDFVYLDPPFAVKSRRVFREYGVGSFSTDDVPRLEEALHKIARTGADFLVSYADCKEARGLVGNWNAVRLPVRRQVAGFIGDRRLAYEWLISNRSMRDGISRGGRS
jgi:DNA adenine methylase